MGLTARKEERVSSVHHNTTEQAIEDFIPIACHYDPSTLLDKNGNLIQVIEVLGFDHNDDNFQAWDLRELVRKAISENIKDSDFVVYTHVIRDRRDIMPQSVEPFGFANKLRQEWCRKNNWDRQLANTLYISILIKGPAVSMFNAYTFFFSTLKRRYEAGLAKKQERLNNVSTKIIETLARFGARRLSLVEKETTCISEPLSFFYKLIHLYTKPISLPIRDFSEHLANLNIKYFFNTMEIEDADQTRYAAIYTIKETYNIKAEAYDKILQLGAQFIISECFYTVNAGLVKKHYSSIKEMAEAGRQRQLLQHNGIEEILNADKGQSGDYCHYQINITVYSDDARFFQDKIRMICKALAEMGLAVAREDFNMARCFWAQLPGNMKMLCRTRYGSTNRVGAFTSIHHRNLGCYNGSKWGVPITLFRHLDGNPFYFNYHRGENGNTLIVGPVGSGKTLLMRFLITQTCKLMPRIIYIDMEGRGERFLSEVGGMHLQLGVDDICPVQIPPFNLQLFGGNIEHLKNWLQRAMGLLPEQCSKQFHDLVAEVMASDVDAKDKYELFKSKIEQSEDMILKAGFARFLGTETYSNFFSEDIMDVFELESIVSIDLSKANNPLLLELYIPLLLAKLPDVLDGRPTLVALNNAQALFTQYSFAPLLPTWLQTLTSKNAIALFSTSDTPELQQSEALKESLPHFATKFFLSDRYADKYFRRAYGLTEWEQYKVKSYDVERRMFVLKQGDFTIISSANLEDLPEIREVLC